MDVLVKDQEEVHCDHVDGEEQGEDSNSEDSALNWEAAAAS